jgi:hypothetical protein
MVGSGVIVGETVIVGVEIAATATGAEAAGLVGRVFID